jgi:hypothetical protein
MQITKSNRNAKGVVAEVSNLSTFTSSGTFVRMSQAESRRLDRNVARQREIEEIQRKLSILKEKMNILRAQAELRFIRENAQEYDHRYGSLSKISDLLNDDNEYLFSDDEKYALKTIYCQAFKDFNHWVNEGITCLVLVMSSES